MTPLAGAGPFLRGRGGGAEEAGESGPGPCAHPLQHHHPHRIRRQHPRRPHRLLQQEHEKHHQPSHSQPRGEDSGG